MKASDLVDELTGFGLDERSAKVYYHLSQLGAATASEVSQASDVQRTEVYRVMDDLEDHGFVEKTLERPRKYVAKPVDEALDAKLEERRHEIEQLEETQDQLVERWPTAHHEDTARRERFSVHQGRTQIQGVLERMVSRAEEEILLVAPHRGLVRLDTMGILDEVEEEATGDASVRVLTEITEDDRAIVERLAETAQIRHLEMPGYAQFLLVDTSEIALFVSLDPVVSTQGTGETVLWLNPQDFLLAQKALFDTLWATGVDHDAKVDELSIGHPAEQVEVVRGRWMRYERMKEMLHGAEETAHLALPQVERERLDRSGLGRALERAAQQGLSVEVVSETELDLEAVSMESAGRTPGLAVMTTDGEQALLVMGAKRSPGSVASADEWSVWTTMPEAVEHAEAMIDRAHPDRTAPRSSPEPS